MGPILLYMLLSAALSLSPGGPAVKGTVKEKSGEPVPGASLVSCAGNGRTLSYAITDAEGRYSMECPEGTAYVRVSSLGFRTLSLSPEAFAENPDIVLEQEEFKLREAAVSAQRIQERGDTLSYSVAGFRQAQDRSIADVIGKMPGLEVKEDGKIEYLGKAIDNFYIEGMDLMGSGYSLASGNIPADKVKEVQVLENHQKVKSLRGISFSESAALNIVLKDEAKAVWSGLADIGAGYAEDGAGFIHDSRLMAMRFGSSFQSLMMYKDNNTGSYIGSEVKDLAGILGYNEETGLIGMMNLGGPSFSTERYTFNNSGMLAGHWLWKTGKDSELRLNVSGFHDRTTMSSESATTYLTIEGNPAVTESWNIRNLRNELKGGLTYTLNTDRTWIRSETRFYYDRDSGTGTVEYNSGERELLVQPYKRILSEDISISHTTSGGHRWQFSSSTGATFLPGRLLTVNGDTQFTDLGLFSSRNSIGYDFRRGRFSMTGKAGADLRRQDMNGNIWSIVQPYIEPSFQVTAGDHRINGQLKASYARQAYNGNASGQLWAEPSLNWNWTPGAKSTFRLGYSLYARPVEGTGIVDIPVYTGYRSVFIGSGIAGATFSHSFSGSYSYRNPVNGLFLNISPAFIRRYGNPLYENTMDSDVYVRTGTGLSYNSDTFMTSGRIARSFIPAHCTIGLSASLSSSGYSCLSAGEVLRSMTGIGTVSADFSLRPVSIATIEGRSSVSTSTRRNYGRQEDRPYSVSDWAHFMRISLFPAKGWTVSMNNELYHSSEKDFGVNWFCDLGIGYKADRWELTLSASNIAGISEYRRIRVSSDVRSYTMTLLRPREYLLKLSIDL